MDPGAPTNQAGIKLKQLREQCGLTLREVEARSRRLAKRKLNQDFFISRGWLNNIESVFLQRILFEKQAMLLVDVAKQSEWRQIQALDGAHSWLGVPLIAGGHVLGILSLGARTPSVFTPEHLRLAKSLAVPAAVAIQNARAHERAEIYAAELELRLKGQFRTKV